MGDTTKLVLADSLDAARVGQAVALDARGNVTTAAQRRRQTITWVTVAAALWTADILLFGLTWVTLPSIAFALGVGCAVFVPARAVQAGVAHLAAGRDDEAEAVLTRSRWRYAWWPSMRLQAETTLAAVAWRRGDHARALQLYDGVLAATRRGGTLSWMARCHRARLLVIMGRSGEVSPAELDGAPDGEWFTGARQELLLTRAFHAGDAAALPGDDTLHDWARAALMRSQYDTALGYLAWAFDARGDVEMARHLVNEALERQREVADTTDTKMREWLATRAAPA